MILISGGKGKITDKQRKYRSKSFRDPVYRYFFGEPALLRLYTMYARTRNTWKARIAIRPVPSLNPLVDKARAVDVSSFFFVRKSE